MITYTVDFFSCYATSNNLKDAQVKLTEILNLLSPNLQEKSNVVDVHRENSEDFVKNVFELEFYSFQVDAKDFKEAERKVLAEFPIHLGLAIEDAYDRIELKPTLKGFDDIEYTLNGKKFCEFHIYTEGKIMKNPLMDKPFTERGEKFMWLYSTVFQNAIGDDCILTVKKISQRQVSKICRIDKRGLILFKGYFYSEINQHGNPRNKVIPLPDKVTKEDIKKFLEKIEKNHKKYSSILNLEFYLIGTKLYEKYCKKSELGITETGNTLFGDWWSLFIQANHNPNLTYKKFTRKNFEKSLDKAKKYVKSQSKEYSDKKIYFSYPKIQWHKGSEKL